MKSMALIACAALMSAGTFAAAADTAGAPTREKALMFYFTKSFGSRQRQNHSPLAFGMRLQSDSPIDPDRPIDLLDLRYSLGGRTTLGASGALMYDSYSENYYKNPWLYVGLGVAVIGGMCASDEWPCRSSRRSSTESPGLD